MTPDLLRCGTTHARLVSHVQKPPGPFIVEAGADVGKGGDPCGRLRSLHGSWLMHFAPSEEGTLAVAFVPFTAHGSCISHLQKRGPLRSPSFPSRLMAHAFRTFGRGDPCGRLRSLHGSWLMHFAPSEEGTLAVAFVPFTALLQY